MSNVVNIVNDATCLRKYIPLSRGKTYISNFIEPKNLPFLTNQPRAERPYLVKKGFKLYTPER
jgi:hypothetical protein